MEKLKNFFKTKYGMFLAIYTALLLVVLLGCLVRIHSLLVEFESYQPERVVEAQIEIIYNAAKEGKLEEILPIPQELSYIETIVHPTNGEEFDRYPESFINSILEGQLTYAQTQDSFGSGEASFNILSDNKPIVKVNLVSENERTQMIVFTCADWSLKDMSPVAFEQEFTVPSIIKVNYNGKELFGTKLDNGKTEYKLWDFGSADVEFIDIFGNVEKQYGKVRKSFNSVQLTVPSGFRVVADGVDAPKDSGEHIKYPQFLYAYNYIDAPTLINYNICKLEGTEKPVIEIYDNLGNKIDYNYEKDFRIEEYVPTEQMPDKFPGDVDVMDIAKKWSLFLTNDQPGGFSAITPYLLKDSYLYDVAFKWSIGIDRTFTSIHRLHNPPFADEELSNFISYSDNCFSCDVFFVKKMHIANGLDVDDEFSKRLYFIKPDGENKWYLIEMFGRDHENADETAVENEESEVAENE